MGAISVRMSRCNHGVISVVRHDLGRGGSTIWVGLGLAGWSELGVGLCVELRVVRGLELK